MFSTEVKVDVVKNLWYLIKIAWPPIRTLNVTHTLRKKKQPQTNEHSDRVLENQPQPTKHLDSTKV